MEKINIVIAGRFDPHILLRAEQNTELNISYGQNIDETRDQWATAEALVIRSATKVDRQFLKHFPKLKVIVTATSGFDHIELEATQDLKVFHTPQAHVQSVTELTAMFMLTAFRKYSKAKAQMDKGEWDRRQLQGSLLRGKTLGVIGVGRIGTSVAKMALSLGLKVQGYDPYIGEHDPEIEMCGFEELMRSSDIVSLHLPMTQKTRHMIKAETLSWMSDSALLINTCRGPVISESDLVLHLQKNSHFMAALDVFEHEPVKKGSLILSLPNVVTSPHIGATTEEALVQSSEEALAKATACLKGDHVSDILPPKELWWSDNAKHSEKGSN